MTRLHFIKIKKIKKWKSILELNNHSAIKCVRELAVRWNSTKEVLHKIKKADKTVKVNIKKVIKALKDVRKFLNCPYLCLVNL